MARRILVAVPFVGALLYMTAPALGLDDAVTTYNTVAVVAAAVLWIVIARCRPEPTVPWLLIGAAQTLWVVGDLVYTAVGGDPTVSVADAAYVAGYAGFAVAAALLLRRRTRERDLDSVLDATLIGIAAFLFLWILIVGPTWDDPGVSTAGRLTSALYPLLDVVLLFFLVRLLLPPGRPAPAVLVFFGSIAAMLVADTAYAALAQTDSYSDDLWRTLDGLWLVGYALLPVAVVLQRGQPLVVSEPAALRRSSRFSGLLAAGVALVAIPTADAASRTTGRPMTTAVLAAAWGSIVALVFTRIIRLHVSLDTAFAEVDRQQRYYRAVADNSSDSFVIVSPAGTVLDASGSLDSVLGYAPDVAIGSYAFGVVHADDQPLAQALLARAFAHPDSAVSGEVRVVTADGSSLWMELFCTNLCDDPAVGGIVVNAHDISARKEAEAELERRALHDGLTGLANRALLRDRIEHALARRSRDGSDVGVLFCDLDGFKLVNDTIGHDAGDQLLQVAATRFLDAVRPDDTVARIGGDEFAVLIASGGDLAVEAEVVAGRLLAAMAQPIEIQGTPLVVTTSIGIAVASRGGQQRPDELLRDADTAMYDAKSAGRNRTVVFEPSMGRAVVNRAQLGTDLHRAVARDELTLLYQPIVDLQHGGVTGFEALLRWEHPTRGELAPDQFIGIAEENGTIVEIGCWVLRTACRAAREWGPTGTRDAPMVSVNVSARQLVRPEFVEQVIDALAVSGLPAPSLTIELTESTLVDHTAEAAARLRALNDIGVQIAIDDFGVGQSSLSYLRQFPVDVLKLDRSFVEMITGTDRVPALIGGLLELARTLDLRTLAEGIETPAQRSALAQEGCELGQGFLFSRPVDSLAAGALLSAEHDGLRAEPLLPRP